MGHVNGKRRARERGASAMGNDFYWPRRRSQFVVSVFCCNKVADRSAISINFPLFFCATFPAVVCLRVTCLAGRQGQCQRSKVGLPHDSAARAPWGFALDKSISFGKIVPLFGLVSYPFRHLINPI